MKTRKLVFGSLFALLTAAASGVSAMATDPNAHGGVFDKYPALSLMPYRAAEDFGLGSYSVFRGAQLYVPASEGLTEQWLALQVQRSFAEGGAACRPEVPNVRVQVMAAG